MSVDVLINDDFLSYMAGVNVAVENGTAKTPDQVRAAVLGDAQSWCKDFSGDCPNGVPTAEIDSGVAAYQAALGKHASLIASEGLMVSTPITPGQIAQDYGVYYSPSSGMAAPSNIVPPEPVPTSPAFTSPANVAVTAQNTSIAGTAAGAGGSQGGSQTQQSILSPAPGAGPVVAGLGSNNTKLLLVLAGVLILVLLAGK